MLKRKKMKYKRAAMQPGQVQWSLINKTSQEYEIS